MGLANAQPLPMFFTKADLAATWVAAGRPAASLPTDLQVRSLQPIVGKMTNPSPAITLTMTLTYR